MTVSLPTSMPDNPDIVEPCEDCPPTVSITDLAQLFPSDHDMLAAILAELIMIRKTMSETMDGLAAIGSGGFGSLFAGLFGRTSGG